MAECGAREPGQAVPHDLIPGFRIVIAVPVAAELGNQAYGVAEPLPWFHVVLPRIAAQEVDFVISLSVNIRLGLQSGTCRPRRVMTMMGPAITALIAITRCNRPAVRNSRNSVRQPDFRTLKNFLYGCCLFGKFP